MFNIFKILNIYWLIIVVGGVATANVLTRYFSMSDEMAFIIVFLIILFIDNFFARVRIGFLESKMDNLESRLSELAKKK